MSDRIPPGPAEPNPRPASDPGREPPAREPGLEKKGPPIDDPSNRKAPFGDPPAKEAPVIDPNRRSGAV